MTWVCVLLLMNILLTLVNIYLTVKSKQAEPDVTVEEVRTKREKQKQDLRPSEDPYQKAFWGEPKEKRKSTVRE